jgi:hypothetical protein
MRIVQTKPVFIEGKGNDYGRQGKPTQRNEIMNTYEELKYRLDWTFAAKNQQEKQQKIAHLTFLYRN